MASKRARRWSSNYDPRSSILDKSEAVDGNYTILPANQQRQPLPLHGIGPHEVRGRVEAEDLGGLSDATGRQVVSSARRQMYGAVGHVPEDAIGQQVGQMAVDRRVRLTQDERQFHRVDERQPAEGVEQLRSEGAMFPAYQERGVLGSRGGCQRRCAGLSHRLSR